MKPWYTKKKLWVALLTGVSYAIGSYTGNSEVSEGILYLGMTLITALGLEDFGKAKVS